MKLEWTRRSKSRLRSALRKGTGTNGPHASQRECFFRKKILKKQTGSELLSALMDDQKYFKALKTHCQIEKRKHDSTRN